MIEKSSWSLFEEYRYGWGLVGVLTIREGRGGWVLPRCRTRYNLEIWIINLLEIKGKIVVGISSSCSRVGDLRGGSDIARLRLPGDSNQRFLGRNFDGDRLDLPVYWKSFRDFMLHFSKIFSKTKSSILSRFFHQTLHLFSIFMKSGITQFLCSIVAARGAPKHLLSTATVFLAATLKRLIHTTRDQRGIDQKLFKILQKKSAFALTSNNCRMPPK